jgi:general secretion pathway protein A
MYENFYGLKEKPFHIVPNPNFLFLSPKHRNALTHLEYGLMERVGFILLTGEIGTGKTTLIRYLLNQMEPDMETAVIFNTNVSADELLNLILNEYEIKSESNSKVKILEQLYQFLIEKFAEGKRVLLIIDEAQNLSNEAIEEVRMLSNLQSEDQMLLQIMLVGHPELKDKLRESSLAQFTQRIAVNYHLSALAREDTGLYIAFRLEKVGGRPDIFTESAIDMIYKASGGIPRSINLLCDSALTYGFADELEIIDTAVIEQVIEDKGGIGLVHDKAGNKVSVTTAPDSDPVPNPAIDGRLESLETTVVKLRKALKQVAQASGTLPGGAGADVVKKLKKLLFRERRRNAFLLTKYSQLRGQYIGIQSAKPTGDKDSVAPPSPPPPPELKPEVKEEKVEKKIPSANLAQIDSSMLLPTDLTFPSDDKDFQL